MSIHLGCLRSFTLNKTFQLQLLKHLALTLFLQVGGLTAHTEAKAMVMNLLTFWQNI